MNSTKQGDLLASFIHVHQSSVRSVDLERDIEIPLVADGYILTAQARRSLSRIVEQLDGPTPVRAWTLTGPYGSGKSLFGLYMMNLTGAANQAHLRALEQLDQIDAPLASRIRDVSALGTSNGMLSVPITGYRAPLQECLQHGLRRSLTSMPSHPVIDQLLNDKAFWTPGIDSRRFVEWLESLLDVLVTPELNYSGILIVLDELGKPLEYAGAHPDLADIYFLQELAELANRSGEKPLVFVGILHQAFEHYAGQLDSITQREWAKIQGRYEDVAFQEPPTQQMRLLSSALQYKEGDALTGIQPLVKRSADEATEQNWCPPLMKAAEFHKLCLSSYPFHPTALVVLPYIFRRLAQNERSLFAFLTSYEPFGFQEFLNSHTTPATIRLSDLFDYLAANFQARLYSTLRARPITEALERLGDTPNLSPVSIEIIKTIALLNWLTESGAFQATEENVLFAVRRPEHSPKAVRAAIDELKAKSMVVFRRFNRTYAIWQGSDVDIESRLDDARQRLTGNFSVAQAVQDHLPPQPMVARRHSYQTGTVRYFEVRFVDGLTKDQVELTKGTGSSGLVLLCLSTSSMEAGVFDEWAQREHFRDFKEVIIGVTRRTIRLNEFLQELRCLHWVKENTPELRDDPVARRELRTRINTLETLIRGELDESLRFQGLVEAESCRWYHLGQEVTAQAERSVSALLSVVCDDLYGSSPKLHNELINRRFLSSQGAAARRNLIEAMLNRAEEPMLGIEGFPPERSMYESMLKQSGLHREVTPGLWSFNGPPSDDPLHLWPTWQTLLDTVFAMPPEPQQVDNLFARLNAAPFGLLDGVLPVFLCAFTIVYADETTLYREGSLLPEPEIADWEVLLRRPELFSIAGCRIIGPRAAVVARLAQGLGTAEAVMPIVRELIRQLKALPDYAWRTQRLTAETLAARRAIETARSPEVLLFQELPEIFGVPAFGENVASETHVGMFFEGLNRTLQELANATPSLIIESRDKLLEACGISPGDDGWRQFLALASAMAPLVHDEKLAPFLNRAVDARDADTALESTLAYAASRPPRTWTDRDSDTFVERVQSLGALFRHERNGHEAGAGLTKEQRVRSKKLEESLRVVVQGFEADDPVIVRTALRGLLQDYRVTDTT